MIALAAALGLALGHVLDLCFKRLYTDEPVLGPLERCPSCRTPPATPFFLPFVGFLLHYGRCPNCSSPLPWRALLLPAGGAALFALAAVAIDELAPALLAGLFATLFLTLTFTDLERRLIPNRIVYPCLILAAALSWAWPDRSVLDIFAGGGIGLGIAVFLFAFSLPFSRGGQPAFGMGDVKLIVLTGFVVGYPAVVAAVLVGTISAGVAVVLLLLLRLRTLRDYVAHGPFLALGAVIALLWR